MVAKYWTLAPVADLIHDGPLEGVCAYGYSAVGVEANGIPAYAAVEIVTHQPAVLYGVATQLGPYGLYPTLEIAASGDPWLLVDPLHDTLRALGREYAYSITTLDKRLQRNAVNERMGATLAMPVATLAALLAFVGIYSLFAYAIVRRTREIGVRLAVGATPAAVLPMVLREGVTLTAIGVALGIPTGIMASRGLRALLFGVSESDPLVAASVAVFFLMLTIAAVFIPARRAARLDPVAALRAE